MAQGHANLLFIVPTQAQQDRIGIKCRSVFGIDSDAPASPTDPPTKSTGFPKGPERSGHSLPTTEEAPRQVSTENSME